MTRARAAQQSEFRLTGWHVLAILLGFFAVVIGVDVTFTVLALRTFPGAVSVTPYEDGLTYNRKLAQIEAQQELGWRAAASAGPTAVHVELRDRTGAPLSGLSVTGTLERPATESGRKTLVFREQGSGRYLAETGRLSGAWDLTLTARGGAGRSLEAERRLSWP